MRFLIVVSAALACAAAAPSHLVPFAPYTVQAVALPAALPTISSGDFQAAVIDANVKAADLAQAAIDRARLASDIAAENYNVKAADLAQEAMDKARLDSEVAAEDSKVKTADLAQEGMDKESLVYDVAAEDSKVKAADLAQEAIDKARLASDMAAEDFNVDQEKERLTESFWATEEKKWQALDALKTAEAQFDGAVASKAEILAKTAVVAPYVAPFPAVAPFAPVAPVVYSGFVNPALKSFSTQTIIQTHPEGAKAEGESEKVEAVVKAAEPAPEKAEAEKEKPLEAAAELKSEADKAFAALQAPVIAPIAVAGAYPYAGYTGAFPYAGYTGAYPYSNVAVAPVPLGQPGFKYATTIAHSAVPAATSTFYKTQW